MAWPQSRGGWNADASDFLKTVALNHGFWVKDYRLKYLELRIDTREDAFILRDRDHNLIEPEAVMDAISKFMRKT